MAPSPRNELPMIRASCPICQRQLEAQTLAELPYFPFCGRRCKVVDLGRWLGGSYAMPADEEGESEGSPEERELP